MGLPIAALGVWYALAHGKRRDGAAIALLGAALDVRRDLLRGAEVCRRRQCLLRLLRPDRRLARWSRPHALHGSRRGARRSRRGARHRVPRSGSVFRSSSSSCSLPGLPRSRFPQLLANGLSDFRSMTDPRYHSVAAVIPFLIAATVLGIARIGAQRRGLAAAASWSVAATLALFVGPWARAVGSARSEGARMHLDSTSRRSGTPSPLSRPVRRSSTSNDVGGHLSARKYVYSVPNIGSAEWVVIDRDRALGRSSRLADPHEAPEVVRALVRAARGRRVRGRRSSRGTASSCFGSRRPDARGQLLGRAIDRELVVAVDHARARLLQEVRCVRAIRLVDDDDPVAVREGLPVGPRSQL